MSIDETREPLPPALQLECKELIEELEPEIERCVQCGQYMIALFNCDEGKLNLKGVTMEFPLEQFEAALELLRDNLDKEKLRLEAMQNDRRRTISARDK